MNYICICLKWIGVPWKSLISMAGLQNVILKQGFLVRSGSDYSNTTSALHVAYPDGVALLYEGPRAWKGLTVSLRSSMLLTWMNVALTTNHDVSIALSTGPFNSALANPSPGPDLSEVPVLNKSVFDTGDETRFYCLHEILLDCAASASTPVRRMRFTAVSQQAKVDGMFGEMWCWSDLKIFPWQI
jgi:hypothetical protein